MTYSELFRINIAIAAMHRLNDRILDVSNEFQNTKSSICERVYVSPPLYYLELFELSYPNVTLNQGYGPFFLQCINGMQVTELTGQKFIRLLDAVVTILKYKNITIDHSIYIKIFSGVTVSFVCFWPAFSLACPNYDVLRFQPQAAGNTEPNLCISPQLQFQAPQHPIYAYQIRTNKGKTIGTVFLSSQYVTKSYLTVSIDSFLSTNNNDTAFTELTRVLKNNLR